MELTAANPVTHRRDGQCKNCRPSARGQHFREGGCAHCSRWRDAATQVEVATAQVQTSIAQLQAELATLRQEKQALEQQLLRARSRCAVLEDELGWQAALRRPGSGPYHRANAQAQH